MKTLSIFDQPAGWPSLSDAFSEEFAGGHRIQAAPWGGYAILGHAELLALARNPHADGMAPDQTSMSQTPRIYELLMRSVFTQSGTPHRTARAILVSAMNGVDLQAAAVKAIGASLPASARELDVRRGLVAPLVRNLWASIVGYDSREAEQLEAAVQAMGHILSPAPDLSKTSIAEAGAEQAWVLTRQAVERGTPFSKSIRDALGSDTAAWLIAGMAFDAIETTTIGLTAALRLAALYPNQLTPTAMCASELLRMASPAPMTMRMTSAVVEIGGLRIEKGTPLFMIWAAGNHDPLAFPRPERFNPERHDSRPLMFGSGQHACLGHALVRTALQQLLGFLLDRQPLLTGDPGGWNILLPGDLPSIRISY